MSDMMKKSPAARRDADGTEVEMVRADKRLRHRLQVCVILIFMAGGAFMWWFSGWSKNVEPERALHVVTKSLIVLFLSAVPVGLYLLRLGSKITEEERFPPLGMKVIKEAVVIKGKPARRRGRMLQACGMMIVIIGLLGAWMAARLPKALG